MIAEITEKLEAAQLQVKELMQESNPHSEFTTKEQILNKSSQDKEVIEHFDQTLKNEQLAKRSAETSVALLQKRLDEKRGLIETLKNPKPQIKALGKDFLASEKLASSKKKNSASPIKIREEPIPRLLSKRAKSQTKRFKRNL